MDFNLKLRRNYEYIISNVDLPRLVDFLYQEFIVNDQEKDHLERITRNEGQIPAARQLLNYIIHKENDKLETKFNEALKKSRNEHILKKLQEEFDPSEVSAEIPFEDRQDESHAELKKMSFKLDLLMGYVRDLKQDKSHKMDVPDVVRQFTTEDKVLNVETQNTHKPYSVQSKHLMQFRLLGIEIAHYVVGDLRDNENCGPLAKTLMRLVKDVIKTHSEEFEELVIKLKLAEKEGFDWIMKIIDETFLNDDKDNCRLRLVVIFAFSGWIAKKCKEFGLQKDLHKTVDAIGDFTGYYLHHKIGKTFEEQGGWEKFQKEFSQECSTNQSQWFAWSAVFAATASIISVLAKRS